MKIELTRYRVKRGKEERVNEWLQTLNDRIEEARATLPREQMHVEVIFRERVGEEEFLYWFSIQGESGEPLETSTHEIDKIHCEFGRECIDTTYGAYDPVPQVVLVQAAVAAAMGWAEPHRSTIDWAGQECRPADRVSVERREIS